MESDKVVRLDILYGEKLLGWPADKCFCCKEPITGPTVWLGEVYDGRLERWPFHPKCADQPWPLFETEAP